MLACLGAPLSASAAEVNVYSSRQEALIKPLLDKFTEQTGITVNLVTAKDDALLERLQREGVNSPADVLMTVDAGRLHRAKANGSTQAIESATLTAAIPETYRDPQGHWYGLSMRARPIMYVKGKVDPATLSTYEALADPAFKGKICIRSSSNVYNQSLAAAMIAANGAEATETWAKGMVANMARPPQGGDRDQIKAAAAGECDIAVANTYYLVGMLGSDDPAEVAAAEAMGVFWPNQDGQGDGRGVHVNVSGAAVTASAKNKEQAVKLIEFLASPESQKWYAESNGEYPVRSDAGTSAVLEGWGPFKADAVNLETLGELNPEALKLMDRAGWK
jgi:iron(III) transport system substrate-binding protein